jgi:hypothetical protein
LVGLNLVDDCRNARLEKLKMNNIPERILLTPTLGESEMYIHASVVDKLIEKQREACVKKEKMLIGQLENCINHLHHAKRACNYISYGKIAKSYDDAIESANRTIQNCQNTRLEK